MNLPFLSLTEGYRREKRILLEQVVDMKKENNLLDSDGVHKESQLLRIRDELDKTTLLLKSAENKIRMFESQVRVCATISSPFTMRNRKKIAVSSGSPGLHL